VRPYTGSVIERSDPLQVTAPAGTSASPATGGVPGDGRATGGVTGDGVTTGGVTTDPPVRVPDATIQRRARRMAWLYLAVTVGLVPWIVYLALTLPKRNLERHYRLSWVGFDVLLVVALGMTAYMAFRVDARVQYPAMAAATLLIVDAWFDVTTSGSRSSTMVALVLALVAELPAAVFSLFLARRVSRRVLTLAHLERVQWARESEQSRPG